jgi:hypothetical protein
MPGRMKADISTTFNTSVLLPALLLCLLAYNPSYAAPMDKYVKKYKGVEISEPSDEKLAEYDDYIYYFTNFSFFKPRHKVSPDFIKALILAESSSNPRALSNKNARGLTQILPETGKRAARDLYNREMEFTYVSRKKLKKLLPSKIFDELTSRSNLTTSTLYCAIFYEH